MATDLPPTDAPARREATQPPADRPATAATGARPPLDRSPLLDALVGPQAVQTLRAVLVAIAGLGAAGDLNVNDVATSLAIHPNRVRSWVLRSHDERHAVDVVTEVLALRFANAGEPAAVDVAAAAQALQVHPSTVRRWQRGPLDPPAASDALHRMLATIDSPAATSRVGAVNAAAAAAALGVSTRTIHRWLHADPARSPIPPARAEQLLELTEPSQQTLTREDLTLRHAHDCIHRLRLGRGRGGMTAQYRSTGWLEPHVVSVLEITGTGLRRVAVTKVNTRPLQRIRQEATLIDFSRPLPHKFAATLLRHAVLDTVSGWRVEATPGALDTLPRGRTQAWIASAPLPNLDALGELHG